MRKEVTGDAEDNVSIFYHYVSLYQKKNIEIEYGMRIKIEIEILEIICRGSCYLDNVQFRHATLLFFSGLQRNVPRVITHVQSHFIAHESSCVTRLPLPLWFS